MRECAGDRGTDGRAILLGRSPEPHEQHVRGRIAPDPRKGPCTRDAYAFRRVIERAEQQRLDGRIVNSIVTERIHHGDAQGHGIGSVHRLR